MGLLQGYLVRLLQGYSEVTAGLQLDYSRVTVRLLQGNLVGLLQGNLISEILQCNPRVTAHSFHDHCKIIVFEISFTF